MKNHTSYEMSLFTNTLAQHQHRAFLLEVKNVNPDKILIGTQTLNACIDHTKKTFNFRGQKPINICK